MTEYTYTYSQLSAESVRSMVASIYGLGECVKCIFFVLGLHDNYLIESAGEKYILRIYRNSWRGSDEVQFELDWLAFLNRNTDLVAELITTRKGELSFEIDSPEGARLASLFRYADGYAPGNTIGGNDAQRLGQAVACIHGISDGFQPLRTRQELDVPYLLDESISNIKPYVDSDGFAYLCDVREQINRSMPELGRGSGVYGLCIGDVNPTNFHIGKNHKITLFDFDQCGYGYRAFEIAKFFSSVRNHNDKQEIQDAFLKAYQQFRPLSAAEQEAIPLFEIISIIWVMAIQVANVERIGYKYLQKPYWDRRISDVKKLASACSGKS